MTSADYLGGAASFQDADAATLGALLGERFMDPFDRQNAAPTTWAIFKFLCRHPGVTAAGYVIERARPDYRASLDGVWSPTIDAGLEGDARALCRRASQKSFEGRVDCFWD
ncbi:MAG: hypothetical protein U0R80_00295 [Nocardioidaceae bacterium]